MSYRLARIERLIETTKDFHIVDAPIEMDNKEASAWVCGFHAFRNRIEEILDKEAWDLYKEAQDEVDKGSTKG